MPEETPRLNLNTFSEGETWDHTDVVEAVEEGSIERGPIDQRPATGEYDNVFYHATDQRILWRWDATDGEWVAVGGLGTETDAVPGTSRFESVVTPSVNTDRSHRHGSVVYYNPADSGPYVDGEDAVSDVPDGGTFIVGAGTPYDVQSEGGIHATNRALTVCGEGWYTNGSASGSVISNTGSGVVDEPVVSFASDSRIYGSRLANLAIAHEGGSSFAVEINNNSLSLVDNCFIELNARGHGGIEYSDASFLADCRSTTVRRFAGVGIEVGGTGSEHWFHENFVSSAENSATAALETHRQGTSVIGGQYNVNTDANDGIGILFNNDTGSQNNGGVVMDALCERDVFVDITGDGGNGWDNVHVIRPRAHLNVVDLVTRFDEASECTLRYPKVGNINAGGVGVEWTGNSTSCGVIDGVHQAPVVVASGASNAYIVNQTHMSDGFIGTLSTDANLTVSVAYSTSQNSPVHHDGSDWYHMADAATQYSP